MYTVIRIEYKEIMTYLMILVDDICSNYDFLTYDFRNKNFVDGSFNSDSFQSPRILSKDEMCDLIEKIGRMISVIGLQHLMYDNITSFEELIVEPIHIPENFKFKYDDVLEFS